MPRPIPRKGFQGRKQGFGGSGGSEAFGASGVQS